MTLILLFGLFIGLAILGVPIAAAIGVGVFGSILESGVVNMTYVVRGLVTNVDSFTMTAIPFFVLAGQIMAKCGISQGLFNVANAFLGRKKGGIMMVTVVASMIFGALTGSAFATAASIGLIVLPELQKQGVPKGACAALIATSGCLGQMIPPSTGLVVLGAMNNISISGLFAAELIPGLFCGFCFLVYCHIFGRRHNICDPDAKKYSFKEKLQVIWQAKWALLMPIIILGGIYSGLVTATEAAVVSVVYGFGYGVVNSILAKRRGEEPEFRVKDVLPMLQDTVLSTVGIMFIVGISSGFGKVLTLEGFPTMLSNLAVKYVSSRSMAILLMSLILVVLGTFLDGSAINIIVSPIMYGIATQYGIDPLHFGVMFVFVSTVGLLTPPLGANLFVGCQVCDTTFESAVKYIWPWILTFLIGVLAVLLIPAMSTWLPGLIYG